MQAIPAIKRRDVSMDLLRILACMMVIMLHVVSQNFKMDPKTATWQIFNIYNNATRSCVPLFVMISGAFFINPQKKIPIKNLLFKYVLRILTAYFFWSFFYAGATMLFSHQIAFSVFAFKRLILLAVQSYYHLWYLPMIIGVYLLIPFFQRIAEKDNHLVFYFVVLFLVFGIFKKTLTLIPVPHTNIIQDLANTFSPTLIGSYCGYFLLGYYLYNIDITANSQRLIYLLGIGAYLFLVVGNSMFSISKGVGSSQLFSEFSITTFLQAVALFVFFKYRLSCPKMDNAWEARISRISKYTFGVYLMHALVIKILDIVGFDTLSLPAYFSVPAITVIVFLSCLGATAALSKIPVISKYII